MDSSFLTAINGVDGAGATDTANPTTDKHPHSTLRSKSPLSRTSSLSSCSSSFRSSSFSASYTDNTPLSITPNSSYQFDGVPFSWEQYPGIPKEFSKSHSSSSSLEPNQSSNTILLPLPPKTNPIEKIDIGKKSLSRHESFQRDPFAAALMKCSNNDRRPKSTVKVSRSLSDRFGFVDLPGSCMRCCEVSESNIVLLPRSTGLWDGRSSSK